MPRTPTSPLNKMLIDLVTHLYADGGVAAIVGDKITIHQAMEGVALPFIVVSLESYSRDNSMLRNENGPERDSAVVISCFESDPFNATELAYAVEQAMDLLQQFDGGETFFLNAAQGSTDITLLRGEAATNQGLAECAIASTTYEINHTSN